MKRYIEIVFDDSGSMASNHSSGKPRHLVAKDLFLKSILPTIGNLDDHVVLRLLRETGCNEKLKGTSAIMIANNRIAIENEIRSISNFSKSTPLYLTLRDAIEECANFKRNHAPYSDYLIIVLTDGGDTCSHDIRDVISDAQLKEWKIILPKLEPVLVQFDVTSSISRANLTGAIRFLGGRSVLVDDANKSSLAMVRSTLKKAGFEGNQMPHCIDSNPSGKVWSWVDLEREGISFHHATMLSQYRLLSFEPNLDKDVEHDHYYELKFLHGLAFASQIPYNLVRSMVAQLERPLLYTHDCIRWDFSKAKWVEIKKPEFHSFKVDESARIADIKKDESLNFLSEYDNAKVSMYHRSYEYRVKPMGDYKFTLEEYHEDRLPSSPKPKTIKIGDVIQVKS
jgi:hypothetical protein